MIEELIVKEHVVVDNALFLEGDKIYFEKRYVHIGGECGVNMFKVFSYDKSFIGEFNEVDFDDKFSVI